MNNEKEWKFDGTSLRMEDQAWLPKVHKRQENDRKLISIWLFDIHLTAVLIDVLVETMLYIL